MTLAWAAVLGKNESMNKKSDRSLGPGGVQWILVKMKKRILQRIARTEFAQQAMAEKADLHAFKKKPNLRILLGLGALSLSYVIGWPAIGAITTLSVYLQEPLVAVIGGPFFYGLSHLTFLLGMYLTGYEYSIIFLRWATRMLLEKHLYTPEKVSRTE